MMKNVIWCVWLSVALVWSSGPARAVTKVFQPVIDELVHIDSGNADVVQGGSTAKVLLNADGSECRALLWVPDELFEFDVGRQPKVEISACFYNPDNRIGDRALFLHPLTQGFDAASATWNSPNGVDAWAGGAFMTNGVSGIFSEVDSEGNMKVTWDVRPLLKQAAAWTNLFAHGALIRMDSSDWPASGSPRANLYKTTTNATAPTAYAVVVDAFSSYNDFGVSYIDSRAGDEEAVFWEQGIATVGRIVLNGKDGSECRAIIAMPGDLVAAAVNPERVQSIVATFDAEINNYSGEKVFLYPITGATALELNEDRLGNVIDVDHGPSWVYADGPVSSGTEGTWAAWTTPGGDWDERFEVEAVIVQVTNSTSGTVVFDLTPLWKNDEARALLVANGAIAVMDPDAFPAVLAAMNQPRVNLYRADAYVQERRGKYASIAFTEYESIGQDEISTVYIDSSAPDSSMYSTNSSTLRTLLNGNNATECRTLFTLPSGLSGLDSKRVGDIHLIFTTFRQPSSGYSVQMHAVTTPFSVTGATWNSAASGVAWHTPGGDFSDEYVTGDIRAENSCVVFNLAPLLAPDVAADVVDNGVLIRLVGPFPSSGNVMLNGDGHTASNENARPIVMAVPAELHLQSLALGGGSSLSVDVAGMNPLHTYEIWGTDDIMTPDGEWERLATIPASGFCEWSASAEIGFYQVRIQP